MKQTEKTDDGGKGPRDLAAKLMGAVCAMSIFAVGAGRGIVHLVDCSYRNFGVQPGPVFAFERMLYGITSWISMEFRLIDVEPAKCLASMCEMPYQTRNKSKLPR